MTKYRTVLTGRVNVGKTSILIRLTEGTFTEEKEKEIDPPFRTKTLTLDNETSSILVLDTGGVDKFRDLTSSYYRGSHAVLLIFDVTNRDSFLDVDKWFTTASSYLGQTSAKVFLVGNKIDLSSERDITFQEASAYAEGRSIPYFEISAKEGTGVMELFESILRVIRVKPPQAQAENRKKCCCIV